MNKEQTRAVMAIIKMSFPSFCRNQDNKIMETHWAAMLADDNPVFIAKAVERYIKDDVSGFAPSIGQIRRLAKEISRAEWRAREKQMSFLPGQEIQKVPMPDDIRKKIEQIFR